MWIIKQIDEADFGCEERMPGEPVRVRITLEDQDTYNGVLVFEVAENWLEMQGLDEGDEWPEEIDTEGTDDKAALQAEVMEKFMQAMEELDE